MNVWIAASDNKLDTVKQLISSGTNTANSKDANGYSPMHAAASYGYQELLKYLVEQGGDVNLTDNDLDTPLHMVEDVDMAKLLVEEYKADWRLKNSDGETALDKLRDEDEFPEVIAYLESLQGGDLHVAENIPIPADISSISYSYQEDVGEIDPEKQKELQEIMASENPEEGLRGFVEAAVRNQFGGLSSSSPQSKRTRKSSDTQ